MNDYNAMPQSGHRLELVGREQLTISGVEDVERFDESSIVMSTSAGILVIITLFLMVLNRRAITKAKN